MIPLSDLKNFSAEKAELTILKTLAYFDIFDYPLTEGEIKNFLGISLSDDQFRSALAELVLSTTIFRFSEFYSLHNTPAKAERRLAGNRRAQQLLAKAFKIGAFLHRFPYVRAVAISGSLSKGYAEEKGDIDFFIITKGSRLWIARTILHLFKKLTFLTGRQHLYCMNYFIDEDALGIREKNVYTATEIVTLFPVAGSSAIMKFFEINKWVEEWLPQSSSADHSKMAETSSLFKRCTEGCLNNNLGNKVDNFFFKWTTNRWKRKERRGARNSKGRIMNLVTGRHFAKSDPEAFQKKIINLYEDKIRNLKNHPFRVIN